MMSFQAKRELLAQVASRYQLVPHAQKSVILDEFIAATGYTRKYAIRLLTQPIQRPTPLSRPRARRYGPVVQEALATAWAATNFICAKRLVPFLPALVPILEQHGHLHLADDTRAQLLTLSPATADRILQARRQPDHRHGIATTRSGKLLKHQVPVRTFNDWNDAVPGFMEADLVAHCGTSVAGSYLQSLVLTDVATGWTECLALPYRSQHTVVQALGYALQVLPFPLLGLDTDNGGEFLNAEVVAFCEREHLTFTRGRAYRKNDQCYIEQKNGAIVRNIVGYDRFEGERAYRQLSELYRALRVYVNCFQPSMKLVLKQRDGAKVVRTYDPAKTPVQRLVATTVLTTERQHYLHQLTYALDPVHLLQQIMTLQDALWQHAVITTLPPASTPGGAPLRAEPFQVSVCRSTEDACSGGAAPSAVLPATQPVLLAPAQQRQRAYHRSAPQRSPRWWRTRVDPFARVWDEVSRWLADSPERTAKSVFLELQQRYPGQFPDEHLRTLQRRVQSWRSQSILVFDDQWLQAELLAGPPLPRPLLAIALPMLGAGGETEGCGELSRVTTDSIEHFL